MTTAAEQLLAVQEAGSPHCRGNSYCAFLLLIPPRFAFSPKRGGVLLRIPIYRYDQTALLYVNQLIPHSHQTLSSLKSGVDYS